MTSVSGLNNPTQIPGSGWSVDLPSKSGKIDDAVFVGKTEEDKDISEAQAQIALLEQEKQSLEADKARYEADLKELNQQKTVMTNRKEKLEAEIKANEEKIAEYTQKLTEYNQDLKEEENELQKLKKQYQEKTEKIAELDEQLQQKIAEVLAKSKKNIEDQERKVKDARTEAEALVASGELKEDEVAQYILDKVGGSDVASTAGDLSIINSLCGQIKANIADAQSLVTQIGIKETNINEYSALIASGNTEVKRLKDINDGKNAELSEVNNSISLINSEISSVTSIISSIDTRITAIDIEINELKEGKTPVASGSVYTAPTHSGVGNYVIDNTGSSGATTYNNPFADIIFDKVEYGSVVEALDIQSKTTDMLLETVRTQLINDNEKARNIFANLK